MSDDEKCPRAGASLEPPGHALDAQAEAIVQGKPVRLSDLDSVPNDVARQMLHQLQMHQIELERQTEELRHTQDELDAARERYFNLYDLAPVGYCTVSGAGLILQINVTAAILLGVTRSALINQPISRIILKADLDIFYLLQKQLIKTGKAQSCDLRMIKKDGVPFWASLTVAAAKDGDSAPEMRLVLSDISERKTAEIRQRISERRLHGLVVSAMDAIITVDDMFRVVMYNVAAAKMFGVPEAEMIGSPLERLLPARFRDVHASHVRAFGREGCTARGMGVPGQVFGLRANGEEFPIEATISQVEIEGKKLYTVIMRDVTERSRAETALRWSHEKLRRLMAHQQRIKEDERIRVAREVHDELGSVLTAIKANLSVAMDDDERAGNAPNPRLSNACALLDAAVDTVHKVITDLRPSVLDNLGVWAALEWYAEDTKTRTGLDCSVSIDEALEGSIIDAERSTALFRILQETLTNVSRHANATRVEVRVMHEDGVIKMEVEDDGKGINVDQIPSGKSWGLAGMIERARDFGGDVRFADTSHGTLVTLRLPLEDVDV